MECPKALVDKRNGSSKRPRPFWKTLAIVSTVLFVMTALGVGLGVGQAHREKSGKDGGDDNLQGGPIRRGTWQPKVNATWQIVLQDSIKIDKKGLAIPDVDVWDLDLFDNDAQTFKALHRAGKKVICYFSAGSWEEFRDDKNKFKESDLGKPLDGWPGERWLKLDSANVRSIMGGRIKLAWSKGCDAIDPDNVDGYENDNGINLTAQDSIDYMKFLYEQAKSYNMAIGLKNAGDIIPDVLHMMDFAVNEQCVENEECETFSAFIKAGKPVFHIEYPRGAPKIDPKLAMEICSHKGKSAGSVNFSTAMKKMKLDGFVQYCDGKQYNTPLED